MERIPGWHGKPVHPPARVSLLAVAIAVAALVSVIVGIVVMVVSGARSVLGVAMLFALVALPAAA